MARPRKQETAEPDLKEEKVGEGGDYPETPSGQALKKVGPDGDGEEYAKVKSGARWGTS